MLIPIYNIGITTLVRFPKFGYVQECLTDMPNFKINHATSEYWAVQYWAVQYWAVHHLLLVSGRYLQPLGHNIH